MLAQRMLSLTLACTIALLSLPGCATTTTSKSKSWVAGLSLPGFGTKAASAPSSTASTKKSWFPSWQKKKPMEEALWEEPTLVVAAPKKRSPEEDREIRLEEQLAIGNSQEQACQWERARKLYEDLHKDYPDSVLTMHRLAVVNDRLKRHAEAQRLYRDALKHEPENAQLINDLGYSYFLHGQLDQAQVLLTRAVHLDPNNARFHNNLGMVYGHLGQTEAALKEFRLAGSDADAYYNLAFVHASKEKNEDAKKCFQKALMSDPSHAKSREALASFERFERTPAELQDDDDLYMHDPNTRWVAYVEGSESSNSNNVTHADGGSQNGARTTGQVLKGESNEGSTPRADSGISNAGYLSNKAMQHMHYRSKRNEE